MSLRVKGELSAGDIDRARGNGRQAAFVDGAMHWLDNDGKPGDKVSGSFDFVQRGDVYTLFPQEDRPTSTASRRKRALEDQAKLVHATATEVTDQEEEVLAPSHNAQSIQDWTDDDIAQFARSVVSKPGYTHGNMLANAASPQAAEIQVAQDEQFFEYMARALRIGAPIDMSPIAVDALGEMDIEHGNLGPEISPKGQLTFAPYAHLSNENEIESKKTKERKRMLQSLPLRPPEDEVDQKPEDLWYEREALSRRSSVSSVSAVSDMGQPSNEYPPCEGDCWLHRESQIEGTRPHVFYKPVETVSTPTEIYTPLDNGETRVIEILPAQPNEPISCQLRIIPVPLGESSVASIAYEALSYCWGTTDAERQIICNGRPFPVTANLFSALSTIRSTTQAKTLWVDAVCINQQSIQERNQQVAQMLDIYRGAQSVIVWLGDTAEDSGLAVEGFKQLDSYTLRMSIFTRSHTKQCYAKLRAMYDAQVALLNRSWFRRSWIRQEVTVSKVCVVLCGSDEMTWYQLKRGANRLRRVHRKLDLEGETSLPHFPKSCIEPLQYLVRGWVYGQPIIAASAEIRSIWYYHAGSLLDLLMVGRSFNATDPRDKIYSVLGLARVPLVESDTASSNTNPMVVDYSKSVSEVYQHLAKYIINRDRNLDILCILLTHRDAGSADLPSWVPDWRVPTNHAKLLNCWDFFGSKFAASGFTEASHQDQSDLGTLWVKGLCLDQVGQLIDFTTFVPRGADVPFSTLEPFDKNVHLRRLCQTAAGCTGLVPRDASSEDLIFILRGSKFPIVLRPIGFERNGSDEVETETNESGVDDSGNVEPEEDVEDVFTRFEVVGPCWVPDYMFGRVMTLTADNPDIEWYDICLV